MQIIALTEQLLTTARWNEIAAQDVGASASRSLILSQIKGLGNNKMVSLILYNVVAFLELAGTYIVCFPYSVPGEAHW